MSNATPAVTRELVSTVHEPGAVELSLRTVPLRTLAPDEVLLRVEAAPINPSDLLLLLAAAPPDSFVPGEASVDPTLRAPLPDLKRLRARVARAMPVGNEGAGTVVHTGATAEARALLGRVVAAAPGGGMYAEYRVLSVAQCLVLNVGTTAPEAASAFVNPLTALGFVETMRRQGHQALVNTAAASHLGQILIRVCHADASPLVNIVRRAEQAALLRSLGARYVCCSSDPTFLDDLTQSLFETKATIAFDAIGGGPLLDQILTCMEAAIGRTATAYSRYGSSVHKQVYVYGQLDEGYTPVSRAFGYYWGIGGWLLTSFLTTLEPERRNALKRRIADEIGTTFSSPYAGLLSLRQALNPQALKTYAHLATSSKYAITPHG